MRILMFSLFALPDSCAAATRAISFAKLLQQAGHQVDSLGICDGEETTVEGSYDTVRYKMLRMKQYYGWHAYKRIAQLKKDITEYLQNNAPYDVVILSNVYYDFADVFFAYAKKCGAKLAVNAVEWYEKDDIRFSGIRGKLNFIKNRIALTHTHVKMGNIIAISSLLDDYYATRGCNTVTIPTIVDTQEYSQVANEPKTYGEVLHIAYAGSPARKDYVINAIRALALLSEDERKRIELNFYGPTRQQMERLGLPAEFWEQYGESVVCHGRIPYEQVKSKIAQADFTVLLRPQLRYANAGFPTKVGESMACGTPVIANLTSDLGRYIIDGQTGVICADETPESCAEAFRKALALTSEQRMQMHKNCQEMAEQAFDYRAYIDAMNDFLKK